MMSGLDVAWGSTSLLVSGDDMIEMYDVETSIGGKTSGTLLVLREQGKSLGKCLWYEGRYICGGG